MSKTFECPSCKKQRPVHLIKCPHCGHSLDGIIPDRKAFNRFMQVSPYGRATRPSFIAVLLIFAVAMLFLALYMKY